MADFNGRGRGGRGNFNQDSEGGGRGSYGGGRGNFAARGDFNQSEGGGRGSYGGRGNFPARGDFDQGSGRGGSSARGDFNQGSEAGENSSYTGGRGGRGNYNQDSEGGGRGSYGGGRGNFAARGDFNQTSESSGRGSYGGGRGNFAARGDFDQGSGRGGSYGRGRGNQDSEGQNTRGNYGRGGSNQGSEAGENTRGAHTGGRGGRGDYNQDSEGGSRGSYGGGRGRGYQDSDGQNTRGGYGGGRGGNNQGFEGGRGGGRGNFNQDSEGAGRGGGSYGRGRGYNQDSEGGGRGGGGRSCYKCNEEGHIARDCPSGGGNGGFSGRGGYNQESDGGQNTRGGGFGGRGRGQDRNYGDQENQGGAGRGGFTQSRTGADAPAPVEGQEGETQPQRAPINFVPKARDLEQIYQEDVDSAAVYSQVTDLDDDVIVENSKCEVVRIQNWDEADFDPKILDNVKNRSKYSRPRKIQGATIPFILDHFDIKAQAETGSGKTAAFLLPIIDSCIKAKKSTSEDKFVSELAAPYAVIIGPTRELVLQVFEQALKLANGTGISVAKAYGQYNINRNHEEIRDGCDILIATVGRLKQFVLNEDIFVHKIRYLVLDEADRLLDQNFSEDIKAITSVPRFPDKQKRVTMLFSATFDDSVMAVADQMLKPDAVFITNHRNDPNKKIKQDFIILDNSKSRLDVLTDLLKEELEKVGTTEKMRRTLVFVNTKRSSDMAALYLCQHGVPATSINADRSQDLREKALNDFRNQVVSVLISTDVTARGIDVKHLDHVINFDLPQDAITYTHRIGRTGRITQGFATTLVNGSEPILHEIAESLKKTGPLPESLEKAMKENPQRDLGADAGPSSNFTPAGAPRPPRREPAATNNAQAEIDADYAGNDW